MQTIELTIDESLLAEAQEAANALKMTLSEFITVALERALQQRKTIALERQHAQGYLAHPQRLVEIEEWESAQAWGQP